MNSWWLWKHFSLSTKTILNGILTSVSLILSSSLSSSQTLPCVSLSGSSCPLLGVNLQLSWVYRRRPFDVKNSNPVGNYMFKVSNGNIRTRCEICLKLTIKIPERCQWCWCHWMPLSLLLTLNIFHTLLKCFYC